MAISVFDLFSIGIGPSSSHTVGPMRAAGMFAGRLEEEGLLVRTAAVRAELFGSLGATGYGHGSPKAVLLGLEGNEPHTVDVAEAGRDVERIASTGRLRLLGRDLGDAHEIGFDPDRQLVLHRRRSLPYHANGMTLFAYDAEGTPLLEKTYYSVGGGFVVDEDAAGAGRVKLDDTVLKYPFTSGDELLRLSRETGLSISALMLENELAWRSEQEIRTGLLEIWRVMRECVASGLACEGILPGGLKVRRRATAVAKALRADGDPAGRALEWVTLYAMAAGGLAEVLGGSPEQVENAAEIGMEHNLGLTCDPVGGLVQIPCIERNGMAAVKAVTAARMALRGDGRHHVSLDKVIKTMKETGADMKVKYKETARGGLAVNVIEC
ncbi:serine dehydratase beta chain [Streptomyces cahuitamycinicus]|uniref:L-serine dehydratase n=1 Tax=Streptomyces cahuitamycinicus TaxID=2070367 RepID=A0A2N8TLF5_9ACTN|nr:serine dehydratase beta chain [Streptomyces cahuitamycinicus]PNG19861.1 L-serine ammonia-lyase [Streptomyces cahuitamycinicus]